MPIPMALPPARDYPAYLAQVDNALKFSTTDSDGAAVLKTSRIAGESLEIQKQYLDKAAAEKYIPFPEVMGQYVTADEAAARYANLAAFYDTHKHMWVGTGLLYIDQVFPVEGSMVLKYFADYPDLAEKWSGFSQAKVSTVVVDGPRPSPRVNLPPSTWRSPSTVNLIPRTYWPAFLTLWWTQTVQLL